MSRLKFWLLCRVARWCGLPYCAFDRATASSFVVYAQSSQHMACFIGAVALNGTAQELGAALQRVQALDAAAAHPTVQ